MRAQKTLFMQNKAKFKKARMNVSSVITKDYDNWTLGERGKNKPKTKPKQTQTKPIQTRRLSGVSKAPAALERSKTLSGVKCAGVWGQKPTFSKIFHLLVSQALAFF